MAAGHPKGATGVTPSTPWQAFSCTPPPWRPSEAAIFVGDAAVDHTSWQARRSFLRHHQFAASYAFLHLRGPIDFGVLGVKAG